METGHQLVPSHKVQGAIYLVLNFLKGKKKGGGSTRQLRGLCFLSFSLRQGVPFCQLCPGVGLFGSWLSLKNGRIGLVLVHGQGLLAFFLLPGSCRAEPEREKTAIPEAEQLPQIRLLSLTGRGIQFLELGKFKEALMDFQYSLQVSPGTFSMKFLL